jgi:hypothetical protein
MDSAFPTTGPYRKSATQKIKAMTKKLIRILSHVYYRHFPDLVRASLSNSPPPPSRRNLMRSANKISSGLKNSSLKENEALMCPISPSMNTKPQAPITTSADPKFNHDSLSLPNLPPPPLTHRSRTKASTCSPPRARGIVSPPRTLCTSPTMPQNSDTKVDVETEHLFPVLSPHSKYLSRSPNVIGGSKFLLGSHKDMSSRGDPDEETPKGNEGYLKLF